MEAPEPVRTDGEPGRSGPGVDVRREDEYGVGRPVIASDDPGAYEDLLPRTAA